MLQIHGWFRGKKKDCMPTVCAVSLASKGSLKIYTLVECFKGTWQNMVYPKFMDKKSLTFARTAPFNSFHMEKTLDSPNFRQMAVKSAKTAVIALRAVCFDDQTAHELLPWSDQSFGT